MITDRERETGLDATLQATFGGGCFWCLHAVFEQVEGVAEVRSGYCGGALPDPDYAAVCSGTTGHIEVVTLRYAPEQVDYADLLAIFFAIVPVVEFPVVCAYDASLSFGKYRISE